VPTKKEQERIDRTLATIEKEKNKPVDPVKIAVENRKAAQKKENNEFWDYVMEVGTKRNRRAKWMRWLCAAGIVILLLFLLRGMF